MSKDVSINGVFGTTVPVSASDSAQYLPLTVLQDLVDSDLGDYASGCLITVEDYPVRIAWRTAPTATFGHLLGVGDTIRIKDRNNLLKLRFINGTAGSTANMIITPEFDK
jgi:hypothetical protein